MKRLIAPLALAAVALSPGVALAHSKAKVYKATLPVRGRRRRLRDRLVRQGPARGRQAQRQAVRARAPARAQDDLHLPARVRVEGLRGRRAGRHARPGLEVQAAEDQQGGRGQREGHLAHVHAPPRPPRTTSPSTARPRRGGVGELALCAQLTTKSKPKPTSRSTTSRSTTSRSTTSRRARPAEGRRQAPAARATTLPATPRTSSAARATTRRATRASSAASPRRADSSPGTAARAPVRSTSVVEPALERGAADERHFAVAVDPVAHAQLAHEAERVTRARAVAVAGEHARAGLDRPAAGVQRAPGRGPDRRSAGPAGRGRRRSVSRPSAASRTRRRARGWRRPRERHVRPGSRPARAASSPALSKNFFARSESTPYVRAMSSRSSVLKFCRPRGHFVGDRAQRLFEALGPVVCFVAHALDLASERCRQDQGRRDWGG